MVDNAGDIEEQFQKGTHTTYIISRTDCIVPCFGTCSCTVMHADPSKPTTMSSFDQFIHKVSQKEMQRCGAIIPGTDKVSALGVCT